MKIESLTITSVAIVAATTLIVSYVEPLDTTLPNATYWLEFCLTK